MQSPANNSSHFIESKAGQSRFLWRGICLGTWMLIFTLAWLPNRAFANASNLRPSSRIQDPRGQDQPTNLRTPGDRIPGNQTLGNQTANDRNAIPSDLRVHQPTVVHQPRSHTVGQPNTGLSQTVNQNRQAASAQPPAPEPWVPPSNGLRSLPTPSEVKASEEATQASFKASSDTGKGIPLRPPSAKSSLPSSDHRSTWGSLVSMIASLCIVIGLFLAVAWGMKRTSGKGAPILPKEVVQVLGRSQISPKQYLLVLRFGNRLVLVTQQAGQSETLCEITDPLEVDRISGLCEQHSPNSVTQSFRQVFQQVTSSGPTRTRSKLLG